MSARSFQAAFDEEIVSAVHDQVAQKMLSEHAMSQLEAREG